MEDRFGFSIGEVGTVSQLLGDAIDSGLHVVPDRPKILGPPIFGACRTQPAEHLRPRGLDLQTGIQQSDFATTIKERPSASDACRS